ncbi:N-acetylmannosamine-6-phosphate 2-epimerase [Anaerobacillus alkaliphilus]|uniref:Putative N-acetylmannosamine-6-phosphate 2-epimerase n=1 Tax=Anaerobacillus alkaliphilus TaxID=1548597 RepID=A0A4Q0VUS5_9BACI|nr:N-acetylmannosamine-6-phosphate 2-epimerase [Anaerobacillus alkaliphilus]RXJ02183.1 N-acetylmannosamine-6-phosphate 2-epimerase [Anaerobacillus alkaliphilus]
MVVLYLKSGADFFQKIKGKLIVSSQALENEPLYGSEIMAKMARAAAVGGAVAIRANGADDIAAIKQEVDLPIVGLVKRDYLNSDVYITATKKEVDELLEVGVTVVALDATFQDRPNGESLETLIRYLKSQGQLVMADISTLEEGKLAAKLGADCVSTTLSGYTTYSRQLEGPDFELIEELTRELKIPVIAEGRISTPEQARIALEKGAYAVVVGSAITRPQLITESFVKMITKVERRV